MLFTILVVFLVFNCFFLCFDWVLRGLGLILGIVIYLAGTYLLCTWCLLLRNCCLLFLIVLILFNCFFCVCLGCLVCCAVVWCFWWLFDCILIDIGVTVCIVYRLIGIFCFAWYCGYCCVWLLDLLVLRCLCLFVELVGVVFFIVWVLMCYNLVDVGF